MIRREVVSNRFVSEFVDAAPEYRKLPAPEDDIQGTRQGVGRRRLRSDVVTGS
ncbi:hypothetical protein DPMN_178802 [Dreissena polymorpha]|uniref:Uncharacterized protein n=1 Tax=Dreissena polymorpha TaxID=45954 RepID=A0A9D4ECU7_DREPO|nr:hypothetical protein DPMN_178802 [Dreissena polymorpha]